MFLQCGFGVWRNSALSKCSRCRRFLLPAGAYNCIFEEKFPKMSLKKVISLLLFSVLSVKKLLQNVMLSVIWFLF